MASYTLVLSGSERGKNMASEVSPQQLARQVADTAQARLQLSREHPWLIGSLGGAAVAGIVNYALAPLDMPLLATVILTLPAVILPGLCYEMLFLRRRLEAAVVLLRMSQESDRRL